jgi:hypothetical protein
MRSAAEMDHDTLAGTPTCIGAFTKPHPKPKSTLLKASPVVTVRFYHGNLDTRPSSRRVGPQARIVECLRFGILPWRCSPRDQALTAATQRRRRCGSCFARAANTRIAAGRTSTPLELLALAGGASSSPLATQQFETVFAPRQYASM